MKITLYIILVLTTFLSCVKKDIYPDDCYGYPGGLYKGGFSYAEGSYRNFGDNATFVRTRFIDTINGGWKHHASEKGFFFSTIDENCSKRMSIAVVNIEIDILDTIAIRYSKHGLAKEFPTSSAAIEDVDATIESYNLIEGADNWFLITNVNADTTVVEGKFKLSFVTAHEYYLSGERERWDDPDRPDTLHYTNGQFRAVYRNY